LVTCPVALYTAVKAGSDVSFHLINPDTGNRVRMTPTDPDTGPIERSELVRGYEFEKDKHVILSDEEIQGVRIESTRTIDIDRFVEASEIDRLYWNAPYYLVPDGKLAAEAYAVILKAMAETDRIGIGRIVLHNRERLLALEARPPGIVATSLRSYNEVRAPATFFDEIPEVKADKGMVEIAGKIIDQLSGEFEPETFKDRYEDALRDLIKSKLKGKAKTVVAPEPEDTPANDLMDMLRKSLKEAATPGRTRAPAKAAKTPARRPPAEAPRRATGGRRR
jgi:DNA end-binding protein Ku